MKSLGRFILGLSFLFPALFPATACTSTVVQGSSDPCAQLATKCSKCTLPDLAQTCNAAVASNDPGSCQQGLDDHDIQTNCVDTSSAGPDAGNPSGQDTGTGPQADSGVPTSHDTGAPDTNPGQVDTGPTSTCGAATQCAPLCPAGHCESCESQGVCMAQCAGGGCAQTCEGTASCSYVCSGGGCSMACLGDASCALTCPGGGCTFTCATTGMCATTCSGGGCVGP